MGIRMSNFSPLPKSLVEVKGISILEHQIDFFSKRGVDRVLLLLGHGASEIKERTKYLSNKYGVHISEIEESTPLGTGGSLMNALDSLDENFFVAHGDLIINTRIDKLEDMIENQNFDVAIMYQPTDHPEDSDLIMINEKSELKKFITKPHPNFMGRCLGNVGIYAFQKNTLKKLFSNYSDNQVILDLDRQLLPDLIAMGVIIAAVRNLGFVKDCGTPERLKYVEKNFIHIERTKFKKPAIFIDRDGTINRLAGFISSPDQIILEDDAPFVISEFNRLEFRVIVITNQPVIARGEVSHEELDEIHGTIERSLISFGARIDDFFYCPHHPDSGFENELKELKIVCDCRKPETGLIEAALKIYPTQKNSSWVIGDSWRDIELARRVGIRSIHITSEDNPFMADFSAQSLTEALNIVKSFL